MALNPRVGKLLYGSLFVVLLPAALAAWARGLDRVVALPAYHAPLAGFLLVAASLALMAWGTSALWVHGGGLPMSAYPPERFVVRGPYRVVRHPLYVGAVLLSGGASLAAGSGAGLFLVTPVLAALTVMWVVGYEGPRTRARFGPPRPAPVRLAAATDEPPTAGERLFVVTHLFLPWLALYAGVEALGVPPGSRESWFHWDATLPVVPWTEIGYALTYPFVLAGPLVARTRRDLRWFTTRGWIAMAIIGPLWLLLPLIATAKPVPTDGVLGALLQWERRGDQPVTAFPAFHATWAVLAATLYARRWRTAAGVWWLVAAAMAVSCVTTGMHAAVDVLAGVGVAVVAGRAESLWRLVRGATERLANSWREVTVGPVRFLSHSLWAFAGAWLGLLLYTVLSGSALLGAGLLLTAVGILGAALWAQLVEGSPQLLRPYGYYGAIFAAAAGLLAAHGLGFDAWRIGGGLVVGAALTQAIGRGRCLVQGCCHGAPCPAWLGIRFTHPRSRVTRLSDLGGTPIHPTQLYSMAWMLLVAAALVRFWTLSAPLPFILGAYLLLVGLGRFVEESLRGEPQTAVIGGLRLYQWVSLGFVVVGAAVMVIPGPTAPPLAPPTPGALLAITLFSALAYVAYGVDFPRLNRRFSRLV